MSDPRPVDGFAELCDNSAEAMAFSHSDRGTYKARVVCRAPRARGTKTSANYDCTFDCIIALPISVHAR